VTPGRAEVVVTPSKRFELVYTGTEGKRAIRHGGSVKISWLYCL
jgi:hypothetical protein